MLWLEKIHALNGGDGFYFYDAAARIIDVNTVDMTKIISSLAMIREKRLISTARWPNKSLWFHEALVNAEEAPLNSFEKNNISGLHANQKKSWLGGNLSKPCFMARWSQLEANIRWLQRASWWRVLRPTYAVVQLHEQCGRKSTILSGFQTHLKWGESKNRSSNDSRFGKWNLWDAVMLQFLWFSKSSLKQTYRSNNQTSFCRSNDRSRGLYRESTASGLVAESMPLASSKERALVFQKRQLSEVCPILPMPIASISNPWMSALGLLKKKGAGGATYSR